MDLKQYLSERKALIDQVLAQSLPTGNNLSFRVVEAMRYSLLGGGKRLRPILCLAAAEAVAGETPQVIPVACALEMIHTYSLIHDDLPAMDDDDLRRGRPTCHKQFDEATAILAGDGLLTAAFFVLAEAALQYPGQAAVYAEIIRLIAGAAGYQGMVGGQMADLLAEGQPTTLESGRRNPSTENRSPAHRLGARRRRPRRRLTLSSRGPYQVWRKIWLDLPNYR